MYTRSAWLAALLFALGAVSVQSASAQSYTYSVYVNADANPGTGCHVGVVNGAEVRLDAVVSGGASPQVTQITRSRCNGGTFGPATTIGSGYPVGIGNGLGGTDVIELADDLGQLGAPNAPRFVLSVIASSATGTDELLTQDGSPTGSPIVLGLPAYALPLLGLPALLLLIGLFVVVGGRVARRRAALRSMVALLLVSGIALAANFIVDGNTGDWAGVSPLATDPAGDATSGESAIDLRAFFGAVENGRAYFRIDVSNLRNTPPTAAPATATTLEDNTVTVNLSASDPEGGNLTFAISTPPTLGTLGPIVPVLPNSATVVYTPDPDANGTDTFQFTANDGKGASAPATATITITPVNDIPEFTAQNPPAVNEDAGPQTATVATGIRPGPVTATDEASQVLDFVITTNSNAALFAGTPSISPAGVLSYTPATDAHGTATLTVTLHDDGGTANGGVDTSAPQTITVEVIDVNDPPVVTAGGTLNYTEGDPSAIVDAGVTVTDVDSANLASASVQISTNFQSGADVLSFINTATITGVFSTVTGTLNLTGSDTVANYQTALRSVRYANTSSDPATTPRTVTWTANDGTATSTPATSTITVAAINDPPVVTAGGTLTYTENDPPTPIDAGVTVADADNANLVGAVVAIATNFTAGEDVLSFVNANGITGNFNATTGVLALSGTSSVANYQAALRSVLYANASNNPATAARTVTWTADDGAANSAPVTSTITVIAVNDPPLVTAGGTLAYTENDPATPVDAGMTVVDVDNLNLASATVQITTSYANGQDVLSFTNTATITGAFVAGTGTLTLSGSDTVANYQAALRSVRYANSSNDPNTAARTVTWIASDGATNSLPATSTITVTAVNDAPVVTAGGTLTYTENDPATPIDAGVTVSDVDSTNLASATVQITGNYANGEDLLSFTNTATITGAFVAGTGTLTLSGNDTVANYQAALRNVRYANSSNNPSTSTRTATWIANDGAANSTPATSTIAVVAVNDPPVVTAGGTLTYTESDPATPIDVGVTVSDPDNTTLASASVQITANYANAEDVLSFANTATITGVFVAGTGTLTLTGNDTVANYQAALRNVRYANGSNNPSTAPRTVTWIASDGAASSAPASSTILVISVNDAPVVTAGGTLTYTENDAPALVDAGVTVSDADSANLAGATVQITTNYANGQDGLSFINTATITGVFNTGTGTLTLSGSDTVANYQIALRNVRYANSSNDPSTLPRTVTWIVNDGTDPSAPVTSTITVVAVNDPPLVTAGGTLAYTENDPATIIDSGVSVVDVDNINLASATVQITGNYANGEDVLSFTNTATITGAFVAGTGILTLSGSDTVANYQTALRNVRYANSSNNPSTLARTVTWIASDGAASSPPVTSTITVTAVNDAPVVTAGGTLTYTENDPATPIDTSLTVSDVDNTNLASASVQITANYQNGQDVLSFTNTATITGVFNTGTGILSLTGSDTVANYQTALRSVRYANSSNDPNTTARTVTWIANDGTANSTPATSTITVVAVNDAPVVSAGFVLNYTEADPAAIVDPGVSVSDVDNTNLAGASVQITIGYASGEDVLSFVNTPNINATFNAGTGTLTLTGSDTVANYQAALRSVRYVNTVASPSTAARTVVWIANDGSAASAPALSQILVTRLNVAPTITLGPPLSYTEGSGAVVIDSALSVTDPDTTNLVSAVVQISANYSAAQDVLGFVNAFGITGTFNAGSGTLTLSGSSSVANYQSALRSVRYTNTSNNPSTATRSVTWTANDGIATSTPATGTITVIAVNNAPVVTPPAALPVHTHIGIDVVANAAGYLLAPGSILDPDSSNFVIGGTVPTTTALGGRVTIVTATGAYNYDPPAGVSSGTDSFQYQVCDDGSPVACSAPVAMQFTLSGPRIWFVNPAAAAGGVGTLQRPLQAFASAASAASASGDTLFLYSGNHTGGAVLANGVRVIGQAIGGASFDAVFPLTPPTNSVARPAIGQATPVITTTTGTIAGITLGNGNTLRAIEIGNTTGAGISGNAFGSLTVSDGVRITGSGQALALTNGSFASGSAFTSVSSNSSGGNNIALITVTGTVDLGGGALSGSAASSAAILVSGGSLALTYSGSIAKTTTGNAIDINGRSGGALTLSGNLSSNSSTGVRADGNTGGSLVFSGTSKTFASGTANAVQLNNNSGTSISFTGGGLVLTTTSGIGFNATAGGTFTVEGTGNTIASGPAPAMLVANTNFGLNGATFQSLSSNGAANGIVLNNTGAVAGLTVTGTGAANSGGTIQNTSGHGVSLLNTRSPSFTSLRIQNSAGSGIKGAQVTNFAFVNGSIDNSGTGGGAGESNIGFNNVTTGTENNLSGTVAITGNTLTNASYHGVRIDNYNGTLSAVNISLNTITSSTVASASNGNGIQLVANGSPTTVSIVNNATINNNIITNFPSGSGIRVQGGNANATGPIGTLGIAGDPTNLISITGNRVAGANAANRMALEGILATVAGRGQGNFDISNNGSVANPLANMLGSVISFNALNAGATVTGTINNNVMAPNNTAAGFGIAAGVNGTTASDNPNMTVTINNNTISQTDGNGIIALARATNGVLRAKIQNNSVAAPLTGVRPGIRVDSGNNTAGENTSVCLNISGNTSAGSGGTNGIGLRKQGTVPATDVFGINGMAATASPGVETFVNGLNPAGNGTLLISATSGFTNCSLP